MSRFSLPQGFLNITHLTGIFPASKEQVAAGNAALSTRIQRDESNIYQQDVRINQQDLTISALVKQINSLTPVSIHAQ